MALCCHKCIRQNGRRRGLQPYSESAIKIRDRLPDTACLAFASGLPRGVSFAGYVQLPYQKRRLKRRLFFRLCGLDAPPYFFWSASADTLSRQTGIRI